MNVYNISKKEFKSLNKLQSNSISTEAEMFVFNKHPKWNKEKSLFKKFYITNGEIFSNKLYTVNNLIDLKSSLNIPELVLPTSLISINHKIHGFSLPLIENSVAFYDIQKNINITLEEKITILKKYAKTLEQVHNYPGLYIGDIHEGNFLIDNIGNINIIDLDSAKIGHNNPFPSKYLTTNKIITSIKNKYTINDNCLYNINKNTDTFCFIIMLLNTISGTDINKLDINQFYEYLAYLKTIGYESEIINQLGLIYTNNVNHFDTELLDYIPSNYRSSYKVFDYIKNK